MKHVIKTDGGPIIYRYDKTLSGKILMALTPGKIKQNEKRMLQNRDYSQHNTKYAKFDSCVLVSHIYKDGRKMQLLVTERSVKEDTPPGLNSVLERAFKLQEVLTVADLIENRNQLFDE